MSREIIIKKKMCVFFNLMKLFFFVMEREEKDKDVVILLLCYWEMKGKIKFLKEWWFKYVRGRGWVNERFMVKLI